MSPLSSSKGIIRFGDFDVDLRAGELRKRGSRIKLQVQPFQVLQILLEHAGEVVTREELQRRIWPADTFVDFDHGLNNAVKKLRDALIDNSEKPRYIETLPKRGYRFIGLVEEFGNGAQTTAGAAASATLKPIAAKLTRWTIRRAAFVGGSILTSSVLIVGGYTVDRWRTRNKTQVLPGKTRLVVLPFQNLSGDPTQDFFSLGLTDELITQLGRLNPAKLGVIASTSSTMIRGKPISEVSRAFNVQYVIEGSVRRGGKQVRIDVQLIRASDETHIWANSYTRDLSDILQVQSEVSEAVVQQIPANLHLTPAAAPHSVNPQAHDAYLKGKLYLENRSDPLKSVALFEEAAHLDPSYAPSFAALAEAYNVLGQTPYSLMIPRDAYNKSIAAANRALELDSSLADAHAALGMAAFSFAWDLPAAEREYRLALESDPNHAPAHEWLGEIYAVQGKTKEALEEGQHSLDLDPISPICHEFMAYTYYFAGDYDKSAEESLSILGIQPQFIQARYWLGSAYLQKRMYQDAIEQFRLGRQLSGDSPVMVMAYAYTQAVNGNFAEAQSALRNLQDRRRSHYISPIYFAGIYLALGDRTNTYKFLDLAFDERNDHMLWLNVDPMANPLRSDTRFQDLLRRVNTRATSSVRSQ